MNTRFVIRLLFVAAFLSGILFWLTGRSDYESAGKVHALLPRIEPAAISILQISRGQDEVRLATKDGRWLVENRGGYAADTSKITALMLKLFDLHVNDSTEVVNPDLAALGLADDSFKQGFLKLSLLRTDLSEIVSIYAGQGRKENPRAFAKPSGGQYVRSSESRDAYLVADPITISASPKLWIDTNLLNVLQISIQSIVQFEIDAGAQQEKFRVIRTDLTKDDTPIGVEIKPGKTDGQTYEQSALSQLRTILENTRIDDVFPAANEEVAGLKFDRLTRIGTREGVVYSIYTAEKGAEKRRRIFVRVEVSFDQKIVDEVKSALVVSPRGAEQKELTVASMTDVQRINELFKPWIYELPPYQGQKFRFSLSDLFVVSRPVNILKRE